MKKSMLITIFLIVIMLFITACSSPKEPATPGDTDEVSAEPVDKRDDESDDSSNDVGHRLSAAYVDMMKSNNYMMKYRTFIDFDGVETEALITTVISGEKSAFSTESDEINSATIMEEDKSYLIDHNSKTVMIMPFIMADTADEGIEITQVGSEKLEFVDTGNGTFMGNSRPYEEYAAENVTVLYYFDGNELDGMEMITEGESIIMDVVEMSSNIDESMFEIPEDYQVMEMGN